MQYCPKTLQSRMAGNVDTCRFWLGRSRSRRDRKRHSSYRPHCEADLWAAPSCRQVESHGKACAEKGGGGPPEGRNGAGCCRGCGDLNAFSDCKIGNRGRDGHGRGSRQLTKDDGLHIDY